MARTPLHAANAGGGQFAASGAVAGDHVARVRAEHLRIEAGEFGVLDVPLQATNVGAEYLSWA